MKKFLPWLSSMVIRLLVATLRIKIDDRGRIFDRPDHPPVVIAFWHNRLFLTLHINERYCRGRDSLALISRSRDGQFISDVAARFRVTAARGSSSRNAIAVALTAIHAARNNQRLDIVITPDGPRGPRYELQPGVLRMAQATNRPIVAVTIDFTWKIALKSWDRFQIPLPFSACRVATAEPIPVPENASEAELAKIRDRVKEVLGGD